MLIPEGPKPRQLNYAVTDLRMELRGVNRGI